MSGIEKAQFSRIKSLLKLSDEAMELADRHSIEEFRLRYVVTVSAEYHAEILRQIIDFNLTAKQVKELCEGGVAKRMVFILNSGLNQLGGLLESIASAAQSDEQVSEGKALSDREEAVLQALEMMTRGHTEIIWA